MRSPFMRSSQRSPSMLTDCKQNSETMLQSDFSLYISMILYSDFLSFDQKQAAVQITLDRFHRRSLLSLLLSAFPPSPCLPPPSLSPSHGYTVNPAWLLGMPWDNLCVYQFSSSVYTTTPSYVCYRLGICAWSLLFTHGGCICSV